MKDFTFRSSVLDKRNLDRLIENQNKLVLPFVEKYNGKVVKTIGDSFMVIFEDSQEALQAAIEIQKKSAEYNTGKKVLQKIEFRIALSCGELSETEGINGNDYFGYTVNLASRVLMQTRAGKIMVTKSIFEKLQHEFTLIHLGDMSFKGMLEKEAVYEVLYEAKDISDYESGKLAKDAFRLEIHEKIKNTPREIEDVIFKISAVTAIVSIQPVPFLDIYSSVPLHMYMIKSIGEKYGLDLGVKDIKEILGSLGVGLGGAYALGQGFLAISKIGLPIVGGYLAVPFSFGFTYALGRTISTYFYYRSQNTYISDADIGDIFSQSKKVGVQKGKQEKDAIFQQGKKHKDGILSKIKMFEKHS